MRNANFTYDSDSTQATAITKYLISGEIESLYLNNVNVISGDTFSSLVCAKSFHGYFHNINIKEGSVRLTENKDYVGMITANSLASNFSDINIGFNSEIVSGSNDYLGGISGTLNG